MTFLAVLGAIMTILAAGFGALQFVLPRNARPGFASSFALSWLLGTCIVSGLIWLLGLFAHGAVVPATVGLVCVLLPLLAFRIKGRPGFSWPNWRELRPIELLLAMVLMVQVGIVFYLSYVHTLGGDGILNWEIKARYAYANAGVLPPTYVQDGGRAFSHPEYPLAIPYTELWLYFWVGDSNQFWAKTIFPIFYLAGVVLLTAIVARLTGKRWAGLAGSVLLFFIPQVSVDGGSVIVGYADFPLSVFYLATIGYLLGACRSDDDDSFRIYAVCLALLPWVKREGMVLWLFGVLCGALVIVVRKKSAKNFLALLPGLFVIAGWKFYLWRMHAVSASDFFPLTLSSLESNIHRVSSILSELGSELSDRGKWSLLWPLGLIALAFFVRRYRDLRAPVVLIAVLAPICVYALGYVFSEWPDYIEHIELSIGRLLMHVVPLVVVLIAAALPASRVRTPESVSAD
jgi:hypothetical protein